MRGLNLWSRVLYYISNKEPAPNSIMAPRFMSGDSFKGSWGETCRAADELFTKLPNPASRVHD